MRITEVDFHIRGRREGLVFGHLQPAVPRQRAPQGCWELTNLPAQCGHDSNRLLAGHLDERSKTRMTFYQGRYATVPSAANEIALPVTGYGSVFDFCGSFLDGDGIDDLTAALSADTRVPRTAYAALRAKVPNQQANLRVQPEVDTRGQQAYGFPRA
jgi:hypothetical protein